MFPTSCKVVTKAFSKGDRSCNLALPYSFPRHPTPHAFNCAIWPPGPAYGALIPLEQLA